MSLGSWNIWAIVSQFGVDCCGHVAHSSMLELGSLYLTYFVFIWVSRKQGGPPFQAEQIPLPKEQHSHLYTRYLCVHVWSLDWKGRKRERQREYCVCKVSTHSHEIISDEEESDKDKYHMISLMRHLKKWSYLQNRLTENELMVTRGDMSEGGYIVSLILTYTLAIF